MKKRKGFTLIELLIVIGIIAVLMAIAIVAINPGRQFAKANNARRWADVNTILNAVSQNIVDGKGVWTCAVALPATATTIGSGTGNVDICSCLVPTYIGAIPVDPTTGSITTPPCTTYNTGYTIFQDATNRRVTVAATGQSENGAAPTISVTR
jgi:type IV pilus assembly protein PilA